MPTKISGFYAYASSPAEIGHTIEEAVNIVNSNDTFIVETLKALDIAGHFISEKVLEGIDTCDILVAYISILNFNVTYEIGYAIGRKKRILLTKNRSIKEKLPTIREVGIFDTLGFSDYQNSSELCSFIKNANNSNPLNISSKINTINSQYI